MASVGKHIKQLRTAKGMTQEQLAEKLFVTRQAVSAWETGKALPDVETLERIASALDTEVTEVIYGAKAASDPAALKRKWVQQGVGIGLWLAILYYVLFCCGVWGSWTRGLAYQLSSRYYRVTEQVLPGKWSLEVNLREVYDGAEPVIYEDERGCRIKLCGLDWDGENRDWNLWFRAEGVAHFYTPWSGTLVTGCMDSYLDLRYYTTEKAASLTVTVDGERRAAQLIGSSILDRNALHFGYTLFSGTGHPDTLPEKAALTLEGLLQLRTSWNP